MTNFFGFEIAGEPEEAKKLLTTTRSITTPAHSKVLVRKSIFVKIFLDRASAPQALSIREFVRQYICITVQYSKSFAQCLASSLKKSV